MTALLARLARLAPFAVFLLVVVGVCTHALPSPDLWWQLCGGRDIVSHGRFPWYDEYSFTAEGRPWLNHEWLAECLMYVVYSASGIAGLQVAKVGLVGLAYALVGRVARQDGVRAWAAWGGCCVALLNSDWRSFLDVRPYLATYVLLAGTWVLADRTTRSGERWLAWLLPPLFALWANLHSGVIAGLGLLGALAVAGARDGSWRRLAVALVACVAATGLTPYGWEVLVYPFQFLGRQDDWTRYLNEWARPDWTGAQASFTVYVLATGAAWAAARKRIPARTTWVLVAFLLLASRAWRNQPLFAMASGPIWAACLEVLAIRFAATRTVAWWASSGRTLPRDGLLALLSVAALLGTAGVAGRTCWGDLSLERELFPVRAVRFLEARPLPRRMLNAYGWGGYVAWYLGPRYQVFMDGRASTVYPESVYHDFLMASQGADPSAWREVLRRHDVHMVLVNRWETWHQQRSIGRMLPGAGDWRCIHRDGIAQVYVDSTVSAVSVAGPGPSGGDPEDLDAWPLEALLEDAAVALEAGDASGAARLLAVACRRDPASARAWFLAGVLAARSGDPARAEALTHRAISLDPGIPDAHFNLAVLARLRGDGATALREVEMELAVNSGSAKARGLLDELRKAR